MISSSLEKNLKVLKEKTVLEFKSIFSKKKFSDSLQTQKKEDASPVTIIDTFVSNLVKDMLINDGNYKDYSYLSEEDKHTFSYPCIILDPIDGTKELTKGYPECSISLAIMPSKSVDMGTGWIFNPFNGFEISSLTPFCISPKFSRKPLLGYVSRTEWNKNLYEDVCDPNIILKPIGSVAYKIGLLAAGACDFVITREPKSIWDIAAGTILCKKRGIHLYQKDKIITNFDQIRYQNPLLWCKKKHFQYLKKVFY